MWPNIHIKYPLIWIFSLHLGADFGIGVKAEIVSPLLLPSQKYTDVPTSKIWILRSHSQSHILFLL